MPTLEAGAERSLDAHARTRPVKIDVSSVDVRLSRALHAKVETRVLLALSRFGPRLAKVTVRLAQPPNLLGGIDQRCRMQAWLLPGEGIHAEAIDGTIETAVARAADRLAKRVAGALLEGRPRDSVAAVLPGSARVERTSRRRSPRPRPGRPAAR